MTKFIRLKQVEGGDTIGERRINVAEIATYRDCGDYRQIGLANGMVLINVTQSLEAIDALIEAATSPVVPSLSQLLDSLGAEIQASGRED